MRVLALDSSGLVASVAVVEGKEGNADACTIAEQENPFPDAAADAG